MTTIQDVLAARLSNDLLLDDVRQIDGKTYVRLQELTISCDRFTVLAAGGLTTTVPIDNLKSTLESRGVIHLALQSAFIEVTAT